MNLHDLLIVIMTINGCLLAPFVLIGFSMLCDWLYRKLVCPTKRAGDKSQHRL